MFNEHLLVLPSSPIKTAVIVFEDSGVYSKEPIGENLFPFISTLATLVADQLMIQLLPLTTLFKFDLKYKMLILQKKYKANEVISKLKLRIGQERH